MRLELHYESQGEQLGQKPPLVILHGLFGNTDNWASRARQYARHFRVHSLDLRNHGNSAHHDVMDYPSMAGDVAQTLDTLKVERCHLMGHSMGGKVAMQMACSLEDRISKLVVVDIAPKPYAASHLHILQSMLDVDLTSVKKRSQADELLSVAETDPAVRAFLLKNLQRVEQGFRWQLNLPSLAKNYSRLLEAPQLQRTCQAQTLFIQGADSDYLQASDTEVVQRWFPNASLKVIDGAGHWPHATKPTVFDHILLGFLG